MANASDVEDVIRREHDALAAESRLARCPPFVAVNNMEDVARSPRRLREDHPTNVIPLSGSTGAAFVVDCPSLESTALWVGTDNGNYAADYLLYLKSVYKLDIEKIPSAFDVDHLYNQKRASNYGMRFIRSALVERPVNRSHGGSSEKDVTKNEELRERRDMKLMDELTSMKYFGFLSPLRNDPRESEIAAYANFASMKLGLDPKDVRESVLYLRQKASTPWARKP
jgi:hypothetical protein